MPPARSARSATAARSASAASAAPRRQPRPEPRQPRPEPRRPQRVALRAPKLRVRWERVGRFSLLLVLMVVVGLYAEHTLSLFSTHRQAEQQKAIVDGLVHQNASLRRTLTSLNDPQTIVRDARALGMVRPGEQSYAITGQSSP